MAIPLRPIKIRISARPLAPVRRVLSPPHPLLERDTIEALLGRLMLEGLVRLFRTFIDVRR
jgi:hypothetical protein